MTPDAQPPPWPGRQSQDNSGGGKSKAKDTRRSKRGLPVVLSPPGRPDESYWRQLLDDVDRGELVEVVE